MGTVITVMNMKGGVGKSTVTMHLGGLLGRRIVAGKPRRVLLIDYDPQFNLSQAFIKPKKYYELEKSRKTTLAILQDDELELDPYKLQVPENSVPPAVKDLVFNYYKSTKGRVDLIPSTMDLMYIALGQSGARTKPIENRFRAFIDECKSLYDVVFIDCHPAGSIFTKTSLQNSQHVIIPVAPERFAMRGIGLMLEFIGAQKSGESAPKPHILFNLVPRTGKSKFETTIRTNKKLKDHCMVETLTNFKVFGDPQAGDGFVWSSQKPWSTQAFYRLWSVSEDIVKRTGI